eukprot:CAMPEP_0168316558 /NCGR_PEP_ID=MMETSP0210-20121227/16553_1 /TAXON_ID=40633 /ORGANISM="Condylostoma magnum, Strain COL2" /LENGTH=35 /DNA_ID= /DNA_START= /DNA_END= /DNA_ORIENTATION=
MNEETKQEEIVPVGSKTEYAMVKFLKQLGHDDFEE